MEQNEIFELLKKTFGEEKILEYVVTGDEKKGYRDPYILVDSGALVEICDFLKNDESTCFETLHCVSAVEWPDYFESVYHLRSMTHKHWVTLKVRTLKEKPCVPSVVSVWPTANWLERECYDLMGIEYEGHPNLKRILLDEAWEGFPLRKDYTMPEHERLRDLGF